MKKRNQKNGLNITNKGNYISSKDYFLAKKLVDC